MRRRCERDSEAAPHVSLLANKLRDSLSASLAAVCEKSASLAATSGGSSALRLNRRDDKPSAPFLSLVYASRAFRQWWLTSGTESSQAQKMAVSYRVRMRTAARTWDGDEANAMY